jgi:hypothetical protein
VSKRTGFILAGAFVAVLALGVLFGLSDLHALRRQLAGVRWSWLAPASLASLLSYASIAGCHRSLLALLGHRVPAWTALRVVTVSVAANRAVRSAGATGLTFLAWFFGRMGVPPSAVLTAWVGFLLLTNALIAIMFLAGIVAVVASSLADGETIGGPAIGAYVTGAACFLAMLVGAWAGLASQRLRRAWTGLAVRLVRRVGRLFRRPEWAEAARGFLDRSITAALDLFRRRRSMAPAWGWAILRISSSMAALWLCFVAADVPVALSVLVLGYIVGKAVGVVALVPAGLGVVEGSMVGVFASFGVPYEAALVVAILNRVAYHVVPALAALVFFGPLVRQARAARVVAATPPGGPSVP